MKLDDFSRHYSDEVVRLPLILSAPASASREAGISFFSENRPEILKLVATHGAVVFRGLGQASVEGDQQMISALGGDQTIDYSGGGGSERKSVSKDISSVTPSPKVLPIPLHNELAYTDHYPEYICFFCTTSPDSGGATSLADGEKIYRDIDPVVRDKLEEHGVCYKRFMYNKTPRLNFGVRKSWQDTFLSEDRAAVERQLDEDNIEYRWSNAGLYTRLTRPAFNVHPVTGNPVWFNHVQMFEQSRPVARLISKSLFGFRDFGAEYGNGDPFQISTLRHINKVLRRYIVNEPWANNDILLVNNMACMHGRAPFKGDRVVTVGMFNV